MRVAGVVLAVLLIAACPPRRGRVVYAVPVPPAPTVPVMPAPTPPGPVRPAREIDPAVENYLTQWEKRVAGASNFRTEIALTRTDLLFKKETNYTGIVLLMRPNMFVMRLDNADDPSKTDYEAYICDGKKLYVYDGKGKTIHEIGCRWAGRSRCFSATENPVLGVLTGVKAKEVVERFDVSLLKKDDNYVYLDIKPRQSKDKAEFQRLRIALYGRARGRPGSRTSRRRCTCSSRTAIRSSGSSPPRRWTSRVWTKRRFSSCR